MKRQNQVSPIRSPLFCSLFSLIHFYIVEGSDLFTCKGKQYTALESNSNNPREFRISKAALDTLKKKLDTIIERL